ncbi:MAG: hypothetical protein HYU52_16050 [Acidobacteria bacterium]|nr:hypothetical protein [Acidobacteriota bacterium]
MIALTLGCRAGYGKPVAGRALLGDDVPEGWMAQLVYPFRGAPGRDA